MNTTPAGDPHKTTANRRIASRTRLYIATSMALLAVALLVALVTAPSRLLAAPTTVHVAAPGDVLDVRANQVTTNDQQEPTLSVDPLDPNIVVAAAKDWRTGPKQVWYYRSTDGGKTFADGHVDTGATELPNGSDPVLYFDATGALYLSFIGYNQDDLTVGGIFVARSPDAGLTWGKPSEVAAHSNIDFHDKEWLTVDRAGKFKGAVYVTWTRFRKITANSERGDIVESHSTDNGQTWSEAVVVSQAAQDDNQGSFPVVGPAGELYVLYYNNQNTPTATTGRGLYIGKSTDGGKTFAQARKVATVSPPLSPLPGSNFRIFVLPTLAVDPHSGALYAAWNDFSGNDTDVMLTRSTDGGHSWSKAVRANSDPATPHHDQFFPYVTVGSDGAVNMLWLDRRDDPNNKLYVPYYAHSVDGGKTFSQWPLTHTASNPDIGFQGTLIGDYLALDTSADGSRAYAAWIDTRGGDQDIYFSAFSTAAPLAAPALPTKSAPSAVPSPQPLDGFAAAPFLSLWQRTDRPVLEGLVNRPWIWGPISFSAAFEPYAQGKNGLRQVQYFDKARMEINNPNGDPSSRSFVTNGLLVVELVSGRIQVGDNEFQAAKPPPLFPLAGDSNSPDALTYASLAPVASLNNNNRAPDRTGQPVTAVLNRAGQASDDPSRAGSVSIAKYEPVLGHNIPDVFWTFMNSQGKVLPVDPSNNPTTHPSDKGGSGGASQESADPDRPVFQVNPPALVQQPLLNWVRDLGYPITEPYWTYVQVGGTAKWVLVQAFQRRVLTYVADNPPGQQVEMGNVGRHYFDWRYGSNWGK